MFPFITSINEITIYFESCVINLSLIVALYFFFSIDLKILKKGLVKDTAFSKHSLTVILLSDLFAVLKFSVPFSSLHANELRDHFTTNYYCQSMSASRQLGSRLP